MCGVACALVCSESVRRQLRRGKLAQQHNDIVMATGVGTLKAVRETDLDPVRRRGEAEQACGMQLMHHQHRRICHGCRVSEDE